MLLFANRLIQAALGTKEPVFSPLVHWWHPLRDAEVRAPGTELGLGHGPKTVDTIIQALSTARVKIKEQDILFFDDLIHTDIRERIPDANYFHVERYVHYGLPLNIYSCFLYVFMKYNLDKNVGLVNEYKKLGLLIGKTNDDIQSFKDHTPTGVNVNVHDTDSILRRLSNLLDKPVAHVTTIKKGLPKSVVVARGGRKATRKSERARLKIYRLLTCLD
jgi:type III secretion system FlhB-like substrate exporter